MEKTSKQKIGSAAEIIKKGGILLQEPCPKCRGLQIRYKERALCLTCSDLSDINKAEPNFLSESLMNLKDVTLRKALDITNIIRNELDVGKQTELVSLLLKYVELLERIDKLIEDKKEQK